MEQNLEISIEGTKKELKYIVKHTELNGINSFIFLYFNS